MFLSPLDARAHHRRYEESVQEMVFRRQAYAAEPQVMGEERFQRQANIWLGVRMVNWGCDLVGPGRMPARDVHPAP